MANPSADAAVGLVQANRGSQTYLGDTSIGTDEHGGFTFLNVHPDEDYFVYGVMGTIKDGGAVAAHECASGGEGATTDAGDLRVVPATASKARLCSPTARPYPPRRG